MNITCWYHDILNLNIYTLILFWIFEKKCCSQNRIIFWLIMKWQPSSLVFFYHNFFQSVIKWSRIITKCYLFCNYFGTCDLWSYNVQFKGRILAHMRIVQEIKKKQTFDLYKVSYDLFVFTKNDQLYQKIPKTEQHEH